MRKFKLDGTVFQDEYGKLSPNAFDVLNNTFGSYVLLAHMAIVNYSKKPLAW